MLQDTVFARSLALALRTCLPARLTPAWPCALPLARHAPNTRAPNTHAQVAARIRHEVQAEAGVTCSCGIAPNKMLAKARACVVVCA